MTRETIAAPRADRMLLRMHYLRILAPLAAVCFGTELTLWASSWVLWRANAFGRDPGQGLDVTAALLALFMALPVGAAVFSRPFKEQHILLFHSLPISRLRQWAIFASASLLALLTVYAGLALLRPNALRLLAGDLGFFAVAVAIAFAAGLCFSLVFTRTVVVYIAAHIAAVIGPLLIALSLLAPLAAYERHTMPTAGVLPLDTLVNTARIVPPLLVGIPIALVIASLVIASAVFYVRGEVTLPRVQLRNALIVAGAILAIAASAAPVVFAFAGGGRQSTSVRLAPDGRHVAIRRSIEGTPWRKSLRIVDTVSGSATEEWKTTGAELAEWLSPGEIVTLARDVSPLHRLWYLRAPRDVVTWWSPAGEKLHEHTDGTIIDIDTNPAGGVRILVRDGDDLVVRDVGRRGPPRDLLRVPAAGQGRLRGGNLVQVSGDQGSRVWRLEAGGPRELPRASAATERDNVFVYEDVFYPSADALLKTIESKWPAPRAEGDHVSYALKVGTIGRLFAVVSHPATSSATLATLDATKQWRAVATDIALSPVDLRELATTSILPATPALSVLPWRDVAVFRQRENGGIVLRLYDARTGATTNLPVPASEKPLNLVANASSVPEGGVFIRCDSGSTAVAQFLWHNGRLTRVPTGAGLLLGVLPDGSSFRESKGSIVRRDATGAVTRSIDLPK